MSWLNSTILSPFCFLRACICKVERACESVWEVSQEAPLPCSWPKDGRTRTRGDWSERQRDEMDSGSRQRTKRNGSMLVLVLVQPVNWLFFQCRQNWVWRNREKVAAGQARATSGEVGLDVLGGRDCRRRRCWWWMVVLTATKSSQMGGGGGRGVSGRR